MKDNDNWHLSAIVNSTTHGPSGKAMMRKTISNFLEIYDSIERIIKESEEEQSGTPSMLIENLKTIRKQFITAFNEIGITFYDSCGKPFDPALHEAIDCITGDYPENIVINEVSKGCMWHGKIFRFARVIVAKKSK